MESSKHSLSGSDPKQEKKNWIIKQKGFNSSARLMWQSARKQLKYFWNFTMTFYPISAVQSYNISLATWVQGRKIGNLQSQRTKYRKIAAISAKYWFYSYASDISSSLVSCVLHNDLGLRSQQAFCLTSSPKFEQRE